MGIFCDTAEREQILLEEEQNSIYIKATVGGVRIFEEFV